jgi:hypothetical protein
MKHKQNRCCMSSYGTTRRIENNYPNWAIAIGYHAVGLSYYVGLEGYISKTLPLKGAHHVPFKPYDEFNSPEFFHIEEFLPTATEEQKYLLSNLISGDPKNLELRRKAYDLRVKVNGFKVEENRQKIACERSYYDQYTYDGCVVYDLLYALKALDNQKLLKRINKCRKKASKKC